MSGHWISDYLHAPAEVSESQWAQVTGPLYVWHDFANLSAPAIYDTIQKYLHAKEKLEDTADGQTGAG